MTSSQLLSHRLQLLWLADLDRESRIAGLRGTWNNVPRRSEAFAEDLDDAASTGRAMLAGVQPAFALTA